MPTGSSPSHAPDSDPPRIRPQRPPPNPSHDWRPTPTNAQKRRADSHFKEILRGPLFQLHVHILNPRVVVDGVDALLDADA